jgi:hypothetical protein
MEWLLIVLGVIVLIFGSVLLFGAPFLPTLKDQTVKALKLLDLEPGQVLIELGSGEGTILREAARHGIKSIGYEINPLLVIYSKLACWRYRGLIKIHWRNFWNMSLSDIDGIYVFLLKPYMPKLDAKIENEITKSLKVVSFAFAFPDRKPVKEISGLMLYIFEPKRKMKTVSKK